MAMRLEDIVHSGSGDENPEILTPGLSEALMRVRAAITSCRAAGIPENALLAALMIETMPRLVDAYGASGVASVLGGLAAHIAGEAEAGRRQ